MALVLSGSIDISGSMTATTIIVSAPGAAGMVSSSNQLVELNTATGSLIGITNGLTSFTASLNSKTGSYAITGSNTFYGNQTITGSLFISGSGAAPGQSIQIIKDTLGNGTTVEEINMAVTILSAPGQTKLAMGASNAGNYGYIQVMQDGTSWTNRSLTLQPRGGDVTITNGNLVMGTSGKGIDFSATSNGSGTTSSELLNDYETGTWTAALICGTSGTITLNVAPSSCMYTKIGRLVNVSGYIDVQSVSSPTGRLRITGFPFTQISDGVPVGVGYLNNTNAYTGFAIMLGNESDGAYIDRNAGTGADAALDMSSAIKANSEIYFNLTYTTT